MKRGRNVEVNKRGWFDIECEKARVKLRGETKVWKKDGNTSSRERMTVARREYMNLMSNKKGVV